MPTKAELIRQVEQGERVKEIRESLGMTGDAFGERLGQLSRDAGIVAVYGKDKISRIESGRQKMSREEVLLIARLDKKQRGPDWLVFGPPAEAAEPIASAAQVSEEASGAPGPSPKKRKGKTA